MGWSYRKSFGSGPFRVNFSKRGISYSVGVKGARMNFGPRGTYVNLSSHGITYRRKLQGAGQALQPYGQPAMQSLPVATEPVHNIASANIEQLTDTDSKDFISELTEKSQKIAYVNWFGTFPLILFLLVMLFTSFSSNTTITQPATDSLLVRVTSDIGVNIRARPAGALLLSKRQPGVNCSCWLIRATKNGSKSNSMILLAILTVALRLSSMSTTTN
jgi:hypothetical protein